MVRRRYPRKGPIMTREVMQQALEACEVLEKLFKQVELAEDCAMSRSSIECTITERDLRKGLYAAATLREAIAQPVPQAEPDMPAICAALGFDPTNHHNAALCPYCTPVKSAQPVRPAADDFMDITDMLNLESMSPVEGCDEIFKHYTTTFNRTPDALMGKVVKESEKRLMIWWGAHRETIRAALEAYSQKTIAQPAPRNATAAEQLVLNKAMLRAGKVIAAEQSNSDAKRYRWLREQQWNESSLFVVAGSKKEIVLGTDCPSLDRLDAAIDAAILAGGKGGAS